MRRNATRLSRVLDNLSALADLDRGHIPRGRAPVDLAPLLAQLPAALADEVEQHGVAVRATGPDTLPAVSGNAEDLMRAVAELTLHAIQASVPGEAVEVAASVGDGEVVATIAIVAGAAEQTTGSAEGIGHAIAYGIVAAHGGEVHVAATPTGNRTAVHPAAHRAHQPGVGVRGRRCGSRSRPGVAGSTGPAGRGASRAARAAATRHVAVGNRHSPVRPPPRCFQSSSASPRDHRIRCRDRSRCPWGPGC